MEPAYNYWRIETCPPEPEVRIRESLFDINLSKSGKGECQVLISYSENNVWLYNHPSLSELLNS